MRRFKEGLYIIEPDRHFPYQDPRFSNIIYKLIKDYKPQGFVNIGDLLDAPQATEHLKDPRKMGRIEDDIAAVNLHLDKIHAEMPKGSTIDCLEGNHENRISRYIISRAKNLVGMIPAFDKQYEFKDRNACGKCLWTWHDLNIWDSLKIGNTVIHHGHFYNKHVAVQNLERYGIYGVNFLQGHTHRVQYATNGSVFSASIGHGAIASKIAHMPTPNDWQQAITFFTFYNGFPTLEIFKVNNGTCVVRGKIYKG